MTDAARQFVKFLASLAPQHSDTINRAALAVLRKGLMDEADIWIGAIPVVGPYLPGNPYLNRCYIWVGGLYGLYPNHAQGAGDMGRLWQHLSREQPGNSSLDLRFRALLDAQTDQLLPLLRASISLLKTKGIAVDYLQLLSDLCQWPQPDKPVQLRWALHYWTGASAAQATDDAAVHCP